MLSVPKALNLVAVVLGALALGVAVFVLGLRFGWWGPYVFPASSTGTASGTATTATTARASGSSFWGPVAHKREVGDSFSVDATPELTSTSNFVGLAKARSVRVTTLDTFSLDTSGRQVVTIDLGTAFTYGSAFVQFAGAADTATVFTGMTSSVQSSLTMGANYTAAERGDIWIHVTDDYTQARRLSGHATEKTPSGLTLSLTTSLDLFGATYTEMKDYLIGVKSDDGSFFQTSPTTDCYLEAGWIEDNDLKLVFQNTGASVTVANRVIVWSVPA